MLGKLATKHLCQLLDARALSHMIISPHPPACRVPQGALVSPPKPPTLCPKLSNPAPCLSRSRARIALQTGSACCTAPRRTHGAAACRSHTAARREIRRTGAVEWWRQGSIWRHCTQAGPQRPANHAVLITATQHALHNHRAISVAVGGGYERGARIKPDVRLPNHLQTVVVARN